MAIKKAFAPIVELLEQNKDAKVSDVLEQVIALTSAKTGGGGRTSNQVLRDDKGNVTHIFCYYHKMWEPVDKVEFGKKASSPTGYSNMCKEGTSQWSKQQREAKKAKEELLAQVTEGKVKPQDIPAKMEAIDKARTRIVRREDKLGTKEAPAS